VTLRTFPAALLAAQASRSARLAFGMLVRRRDGTQLLLTSADVSESITGVPVYDAATDDVLATGALTYAAHGLDVSNIRSTAGFDVDTWNGSLLDGGVVVKEDVLRGLWRDSAWTLFTYVVGDGTASFGVVKCGRMAEVKCQLGRFELALHDWRRAYQSDQVDVASADCRYDYGDARCGEDKAAATVTGTVTASGGAQSFTDSGRTEADDWFGAGEFEWLTGPNAGHRTKVKTYAADTFVLAEPMLAAIGVSDTYRVVAGCRKRFREDCIAKHGNGNRFGGEPDAPTTNEVVGDTSEA
jgi:uncharacterized phage protein (TIGR02218 family)